MVISRRCICGRIYSVRAENRSSGKAQVAAMKKAESQLAIKISNCDCDIKKPKGFNEDASTETK